MAITLVDGSVNVVSFIGTDDFILSAGKTLKIETSPGGEEVLSIIVPEGKQWRVQINIEITETNI